MKRTIRRLRSPIEFLEKRLLLHQGADVPTSLEMLPKVVVGACDVRDGGSVRFLCVGGQPVGQRAGPRRRERPGREPLPDGRPATGRGQAEPHPEHGRDECCPYNS